MLIVCSGAGETAEQTQELIWKSGSRFWAQRIGMAGRLPWLQYRSNKTRTEWCDTDYHHLRCHLQVIGEMSWLNIALMSDTHHHWTQPSASTRWKIPANQPMSTIVMHLTSVLLSPSLQAKLASACCSVLTIAINKSNSMICSDAIELAIA